MNWKLAGLIVALGSLAPAAWANANVDAVRSKTTDVREKWCQ